MLSRLSAKSLLLLPLSAIACSLTTGCANMVTTAPATNAFSSLGQFSGSVHGGSQFIAGSTINLYAAGTSGYGTGSTLLATTTSSAGGTFGFTQVGTQPGTAGASYACPNANSLLYIVSIGGNTQTSGTASNGAAVMLAPVGVCSTATSKFININEVTTAAAVTALAQYINPGTATPGTVTIGTASDYTLATPAQSGTGFINAFNTVSNLVAISTGQAISSLTLNGSGGASAAVVTLTPEQAKINTIANVLAACVNSVSGAAANCQTLFNNATPPAVANTSQPNTSFATAVDTLQAAYYMATNPIDDTPAGTSTYPTNLTNLYNLGAAAAPFQPMLSAKPTDWTIGVAFSSGTTTCTTTNTALFLNYAYADSIDASGNVWLANGGSSTGGVLAEMSPLGVPLNCSASVADGARGGAAIDTAGNVWGVASSTAPAVIKFDGTTTSTILTGATTASKPYAIAADGRGNVFYTDSTALTLNELPSTATSSTTPTLIGSVSSAGTSPYFLAVDARNTVVIGQSGAGGSIISLFPTTTVGGTAYSGTVQTITSAANYAGVYGVAFDSTGGFWVGNSAGTATSAGTGPGNTTSRTALVYSSAAAGSTFTVTPTPGTPTAVFAGGLSTARVVAIDGAGNVWTPNNSAASSTLYSVSEFSNAGVALSPTITAAGTGTTVTQNGGFQKAANFISSPRGIAIDPSGNVWVTSTNSTSSSLLLEVVGAAVPVVTPISTQAKNNKFAAMP